MSSDPQTAIRRLGKNLSVAATALFLFSCGPLHLPKGDTTGAAEELAESGRVYALVASQSEANRVIRSAKTLGYKPQSVIGLSALDLKMVPVDLPDGVTGEDAIAALETAVPESTVGVNHAYRFQSASADVDRRNYANDMIRWPKGGCRAQTPIGLIDGGIDSKAPVFSGVKIRSRNFSNGSPSSRRHGTEVASVIADATRLTDVSLYSASVVGPNGKGEDVAGAATLVQAIDWMAQQGVTLVNISLSGPSNKLLAQAVDAATQRGVLLVAAVGNDGRTSPVQHPAALPGVIAVTAVDARGRIFKDAVRGPQVDFAAPGVDVFVSSRNGARYVTGTSMAAPFVTAQLATRTRRNKQALVQGVFDLGPIGQDITFGHGLIQALDVCE